MIVMVQITTPKVTAMASVSLQLMNTKALALVQLMQNPIVLTRKSTQENFSLKYLLPAKMQKFGLPV